MVSFTIHGSGVKRWEGCHRAHTFYAVKRMQDIFIAVWVPSFPLGIFLQAAFQMKGHHTRKINNRIIGLALPIQNLGILEELVRNTGFAWLAV